MNEASNHRTKPLRSLGFCSSGLKPMKAVRSRLWAEERQTRLANNRQLGQKRIAIPLMRSRDQMLNGFHERLDPRDQAPDKFLRCVESLGQPIEVARRLMARVVGQ